MAEKKTETKAKKTTKKAVKKEVVTETKKVKVAKTANALIKFFKYEHLPAHLQETSKSFHDLAVSLDESIPNGAEKTAGLRKLLEAKDCFVRANIK